MQIRKSWNCSNKAFGSSWDFDSSIMGGRGNIPRPRNYIWFQKIWDLVYFFFFQWNLHTRLKITEGHLLVKYFCHKRSVWETLTTQCSAYRCFQAQSPASPLKDSEVERDVKDHSLSFWRVPASLCGQYWSSRLNVLVPLEMAPSVLVPQHLPFKPFVWQVVWHTARQPPWGVSASQWINRRQLAVYGQIMLLIIVILFPGMEIQQWFEVLCV